MTKRIKAYILQKHLLIELYFKAIHNNVNMQYLNNNNIMEIKCMSLIKIASM